MTEDTLCKVKALATTYYEECGFELIASCWMCEDGGFDLVVGCGEQLVFVDAEDYERKLDDETIERVQAVAASFVRSRFAESEVHDLRYDIARVLELDGGITFEIDKDMVKVG